MDYSTLTASLASADLRTVFGVVFPILPNPILFIVGINSLYRPNDIDEHGQPKAWDRNLVAQQILKAKTN